MRFPRFKLWSLMLMVVVTALIFAVFTWLAKLNAHLDEMYGPDGLLQRGLRFANEISAGDEELRQGRWKEAEGRYRSALALSRSASDFRFVTYDSIGYEVTPLLGLADALAGQERYSETEPLYERALEILRKWLGTDHLAVVEVLERHARTLRKAGRLAEADAMEAQARTIRDRLEGQETNPQ